jgi:hypothetical protein
MFNNRLGMHIYWWIQMFCRHIRIDVTEYGEGQSKWPRGLRRGSAAARLLGLRVRIPPEHKMAACCERWVLSGRGLCAGLITRPEESYRV